MKSLVLVSIHTAFGSTQSFPLAAAQLKSYAEKFLENPPEIKLLEFSLESSPQEIVQAIVDTSVDAAGFSCYVWNRSLISEVCRQLRKKDSSLFLFAGGAEATADPGKLKEEASLDRVIAGEGEQALVELINGSLLQCPSVDLETSPSPFTPELVKDRPAILWELSRGCPFKCSFCFESRGESGVRSYSMERIEKELDLFVSCGVRQVFVLDPTFNYNKERAKKILKLIIKRAPQIYFYFEVRPEFLDREMAALFSRITCSLQIGLQSSHPSVLKNINRKFNPQSYKEKIGLLNEAGVIFGLDLIYGLPGDSYKGFRESLDYALELLPNHLDIFPLSVLPGTELFDKAPELGLEFLEAPPYLVTSVPGFFPRDREKTEKLARAFWTFYNDGAAVPWFMSVVSSLKIKPSEFLELFAERHDHSPEKSLPSLQKEFTTSLLKERGLGKFSPLARDLISFHSALGFLDNCNSSCLPHNGKVDYGKSYSLSPAASLFIVDHDLYDLWELGIAPLKELASYCEKQKTFSLLFLGEEGILPVSLYKETYDLLSQLDGKTSLEKLVKSKGRISSSTREALQSLFESGVIIS